MRDRKIAMLPMRILKERGSSIKTIIDDGGYRAELTENTINTFGAY